MCLFYSSNDLNFNKNLKYPEIKIDENKVTFIIGKSGSGKSTYLRMLNRMIIPDQGIIKYKGKNINDYDVLEYRQEVLLIPQESFLLDASIKDNFNFYYDARNEKLLKDEEMQFYLDLCLVSFDINDDTTNMSGGERERVFLAIFISLVKNVVLLDEPTSALDETTSIDLLTKLKKYFKEKNITAIIVSHSSKLKELFSDFTIDIGGNNNASIRD